MIASELLVVATALFAVGSPVDFGPVTDSSSIADAVAFAETAPVAAAAPVAVAVVPATVATLAPDELASLTALVSLAFGGVTSSVAAESPAEPPLD